MVDNVFIYTKSSQPEITVDILQKELKNEPVKVYANFSKVYVVPESIDKGKALKKFINDFDFKINNIVSAGDSIFDISLLEAANYAIFPDELPYLHHSDKYIKIPQGELFSDKVVENVIKLI